MYYLILGLACFCAGWVMSLFFEKAEDAEIVKLRAELADEVAYIQTKIGETRTAFTNAEIEVRDFLAKIKTLL